MSEAEQPNMDRQRLIAEIDGLKAEMAQLQQAWPPGHFYSPIPSIEEVKRSEEEIFKIVPNEIPGISLNPQRQLNLLHTLKEFYIEQPYAVNKKKHLRYSLTRQLQSFFMVEVQEEESLILDVFG